MLLGPQIYLGSSNCYQLALVTIDPPRRPSDCLRIQTLSGEGVLSRFWSMLLSTGVSVPALVILGLTPCPECLPGVTPEAGAEGLPSALLVSSSPADCPALFWYLSPSAASSRSYPLSLASWGPFMLQSLIASCYRVVLPAAEPRLPGRVFWPAFCPIGSLGVVLGKLFQGIQVWQRISAFLDAIPPSTSQAAHG